MENDNMKISLLWGLLLLAVPPSGADELVNPALKPDKNGSLPGWTAWDPKNRHQIDDGVVKGVCKAPGGPEFGIHQTVRYDKPNTDPVIFGGWSRAENAGYGGDYCLYLDIRYSDGTYQWKVVKSWSPGTHDWEWINSCYYPAKPVSEIKYHILLRYSTGTAWFRDMLLKRGAPGVMFDYASALSMAPWKQNRYCVRYAFFSDGIKSECRLLDENGKTVGAFTASGKTVRREVDCTAKPAAFEIKASDGKSEKTVRGKISHLEVPAAFENGKKLEIWTADSMEKIGPLTFPGKKVEKTASLELAGNERESIQILVSNADSAPLRDVSLRISPLKNRAGQIFSGEIQWERTAYIPRIVPFASHPEQFPEAVYWLPDPLLPATPFMVPAKATQGTWLTVHAPKQTPGGDYSGLVEVVSGSRILGKIPLKIKVFAFSLPEVFSYRSAFSLMDGYLRYYYPEDWQTVRRKAWDIMLDHRLNPDDITRTEMPSMDDLLHARSRGMNSFNVLHLVPKPKRQVLWTLYAPVGSYGEPLFKEFRERLDPYVAELRKHGLDKLAYFYGFDERKNEFFPAIARVRKFLAENYGIPLMSTSAMYMELAKNPSNREYEETDWFCPMTNYYRPELSEALRKKNHQVWWYTCCGPRYPYANFANLEYPFYEARLMAWMTYFQRADGFLFWHVNNWQKQKILLNDASTYQPDFCSVSVGGATGDGQFLYPGKEAPLPSIRLANLRDGSEDYDYLVLLAEKSPGMAMESAGRLVPELCRFERNPAEIRKVRQHVAEKIGNSVK